MWHSVCSTKQSNLSYIVNGLAADETLQPDLLPALCTLSSACSSNPTLLDRWANPCCEQWLPTARLIRLQQPRKMEILNLWYQIAKNTNPTRTGLCKPAGTWLLTIVYHCPADFAFFCGQMHETLTKYAVNPVPPSLVTKGTGFLPCICKTLRGGSAAAERPPHQFCNN